MGRKTSENEYNYDEYEEKSVPNDVKEGHFAVIAVEGEQIKRFIVPLRCLNHPSFLKLLELAAEELDLIMKVHLPFLADHMN